MRVKEEEKQFAVTITADGFAQYIELDFEAWDAVFSDNYFDLTGKEGKTVKVEKAELPLGISAEEVQKQLRIKSVADSYET